MQTRGFTLFAFLVSLILLVVLLLTNSMLVSAQGTSTTTRVSVASDGTQGNNSSERAWISADGRYVAFLSGASNLVSGDTNSTDDVFVRDRQTGQTSRVSVASNGTEANNYSDKPSISADGRYVAFLSGASNLVSGDTNSTDDVFVRDRQTGQTSRVSVASNGTEANNYSDELSISADGRYVAFESRASNLVSGDTNGYLDIFVHDRQTGQTSRVSVASNGSQGNNPSSRPAISADGRYVVFESGASNLVSGDTNNFPDIFVRDRQTGQTSRVSVASNGSQGNGNSFSYSSAISADGRYVAFSSNASNLVSGDTNGYWDVFVRDRQTGQTSRVSVASNGSQGNNSFDSIYSSISADGRYVAFESRASNLVSGDTNGYLDIFVHDRQTGQTSRVSVASNGSQGNEYSYWPTISADGRYVTFHSGASNLVSGDTNGYLDIFVHDRGVQTYSKCGQAMWATAENGGGVLPVFVLPFDTTPVTRWDPPSFIPGAYYRIMGPQISPLSPPFQSKEYGPVQHKIVSWSSFQQINGLSDCNLIDTDGDGLLDTWEINGYDYNGDGTIDLNLPAMGANPAKKDIFVEIDYMAAPNHNHSPNNNARTDVIAAFAAKGINLHLIVDEAIREIEPIRFDPDMNVEKPPTGTFDELKLGNPINPCGTNPTDAHFGTVADRSSGNCTNIIAARRLVFRYAIFGHNHAHYIGSSGIAERPGNDFMVTLGGWSNFPSIGGRRAAEAGTFMHELGHTLGLQHGGEDGINCKPNYLSVMNYSFQLPDIDPTRPLDYSNQLLPPLNENGGLKESAGIDGPTGRYTIFGLDGVTTIAPANGPINWNGTGGSGDTNVNADINYINAAGCPADGKSTLNSYDDWEKLVFNFRTSADYADGVPRTTPLTQPEITNAQAVAAAQSVDFDGDGYSNAVDNCPAVYNPNQTDADGNGVGDTCQINMIHLPLILK